MTRFDRARFDEHHLELAPGELHGIAFPFMPSMLAERGAAFLTEAFQAAGTLAGDERVGAIEAIEPCTGGQASEKVFLDLTIEGGDSPRRERLFAKMPAADPERKFFLADTAAFEVEFARLTADAELPFAVPRYWFGDYSGRTSNFLLVTERIGYGEGGIAPECHKGMDHLLPDAVERYLVLAKALGALAAAHKRGALGDVETTFPFPRNAPRARPARSPERQLDALVDLIGRRAPAIFPEYARPASFLERFRSDVLFGLAHADALAAALHEHPDAVGLCHPNLNLDNAWFWRDAEGVLHAGLLDWGMTRQMSFGQAIAGMLMFPEPERYAGLVRDVVSAFVETLAGGQGPRLDPKQVRRDLQASLFLSTIPMLLDIVAAQFDRFSPAEWGTMEDRFDPRLIESGLGAGVVWLRNVLEEWHHETTPGDACRALLGIVG